MYQTDLLLILVRISGHKHDQTQADVTGDLSLKRGEAGWVDLNLLTSHLTAPLPVLHTGNGAQVERDRFVRPRIQRSEFGAGN